MQKVPERKARSETCANIAQKLNKNVKLCENVPFRLGENDLILNKNASNEIQDNLCEDVPLRPCENALLLKPNVSTEEMNRLCESDSGKPGENESDDGCTTKIGNEHSRDVHTLGDEPLKPDENDHCHGQSNIRFEGIKPVHNISSIDGVGVNREGAFNRLKPPKILLNDIGKDQHYFKDTNIELPISKSLKTRIYKHKNNLEFEALGTEDNITGADY